MEHFDDYYHEEETLGKVYDAGILKRIAPYVKPYRLHLIVAVCLAVILSGGELLLPYLTKIGIDDFILYSSKLITLTELPQTERTRYQELYLPKALELTRDRMLVKEGVLDPKDRHRLEAANAISPHAFYLVRLSRYTAAEQETLSALNRRNPETFLASSDPDRFCIDSSALSELSPDLRALLRRPDRTGILRISMIYLTTLLLLFGVTFGQAYLMTWIGQKIMFDIRTALFEHIQRLTLQFFNRQPIGRLVTRVSNDVNALNELFTSIIVDIAKNLLTLIGIIIVMVLMAPRLALATYTVLPVIVVVTWIFKQKMRDAYRVVRKTIAQINATLSEHLSGIRVIQVFGRERLHFDKFRKINHDSYLANMHQLVIQSLFSPFIVLLENLGTAIIIFYGGGQVVQERISLGTLVAFLSYVTMFFAPVRDTAEKFNIMQSAMAASERILQLFNQKQEQADDRGHASPGLEKIKGEVRFENVSFAYEDENWVLKDVSFEVKAGETVAIVGATGSGKTTIINLLTRFFSIQKGTIYVDGRDIREFELPTLRRQIAVVLQDVFLFTGDLNRNIRLHETSIPDEEIKRISAIVHADKFIDRLPQGYNTRLEEGGTTLSQGQRQLVAFARALAFDPAILVLDEATAHIDSETERWIQNAIATMLASRTSIVIAHRLSTIKKADKIVVLHKGRVMEIGDHASLLAKKGIYYKLYMLQFQYQESPSWKAQQPPGGAASAPDSAPKD